MLGALRLANYRSYRDLVSEAYLRNLGFDTSCDKIFPDLVFSHPRVAEKNYRPPRSTPKVIGIGVMGYYGWKNKPDQGEAIYQNYLNKLKIFIRWLLENDYNIHLLMGETPVDLRPVDELYNFAKNELPSEWQDRIVGNQINNINDLFQEISLTDLVVGTRFHNVVCSLMLGRPIISIGYSSKNNALMTEMGLQDYCHHIENFDLTKLKQDFLLLVEKQSNLIQQIQLKSKEYYQLLDEQYQVVF
jgi:polysaccharide pyruvyl transferase WcaK-like protein